MEEEPHGLIPSTPANSGLDPSISLWGSSPARTLGSKASSAVSPPRQDQGFHQEGGADKGSFSSGSLQGLLPQPGAPSARQGRACHSLDLAERALLHELHFVLALEPAGGKGAVSGQQAHQVQGREVSRSPHSPLQPRGPSLGSLPGLDHVSLLEALETVAENIAFWLRDTEREASVGGGPSWPWAGGVMWRDPWARSTTPAGWRLKRRRACRAWGSSSMGRAQTNRARGPWMKKSWLQPRARPKLQDPWPWRGAQGHRAGSKCVQDKTVLSFKETCPALKGRKVGPGPQRLLWDPAGRAFHRP